jgi:biopolymer transport protein ExbD
MGRRIVSAKQEDAEVNITPLLDIVFILLIFFIVTATFLDESGIGLTSPEENPPEDQTRPPPTLLLGVQSDGFVRIDNLRLVDPRSVGSVIEEFKAREPRGVVLVNAAPDSKAEVTVLVLDQARQAGVDPAVAIQRAE